MVTPYLEELIWKGSAVYRTYTQGTVNGVIGVPDNKFIVITRIYYDFWIPFAGANQSPSILEARNASIHLLRVRSQKSSNDFLIRESFGIDQDAEQVSPLNNITPRGGREFDLYSIHDSAVSLEISQLPIDPGAIVINSSTGPLEETTPNPNVPTGYGRLPGGLTGIKDVFSTGMVTDFGVSPIPLEIRRTALTQATKYQSFNIPFEAETVPPINISSDNPYYASAFPVMNVHYVEINGPLPEQLKSSQHF